MFNGPPGRHEVSGTFGVVASTHWIASQVAMRMLELGGNAFDAAVAGGLVLQVVEPSSVGLGGEVVILLAERGATAPTVLCGQGTAPTNATIPAYKQRGFDIIPNRGLISTVVPGAFGAWMAMLRDYGSLKLQDVVGPAIYYARTGAPVTPTLRKEIALARRTLLAQPSCVSDIYAPGGKIPAINTLITNPALANTYERIISYAAAVSGSRERQVDRAIEAFYCGFIPEEIEVFTKELSKRHTQETVGDCCFLTADDMACWSPSYERSVGLSYGPYEVYKPGIWTQGPVLLQALSTLGFEGTGNDDSCSQADQIHRHVEVLKLCMADREAYYGDSGNSNVSVSELLDPAYSASRRLLVAGVANAQPLPGAIRAEGWRLPRGTTISKSAGESEDAFEPDTSHISVVDQWHNLVSATPSGGWFWGSPIIPRLGFSLNTRAEMFWLEEGLASTLKAGCRPRTTLAPTMVFHDGKPLLGFGTRGADFSEQWQLQFLLTYLSGRTSLQEAIEAPLFASQSFASSDYPRSVQANTLLIDERLDTILRDRLSLMGHSVKAVAGHKLGRLCAVTISGKVLQAAATGRLSHYLAVGR